MEAPSCGPELGLALVRRLLAAGDEFEGRLDLGSGSACFQRVSHVPEALSGSLLRVSQEVAPHYSREGVAISLFDGLERTMDAFFLTHL